MKEDNKTEKQLIHELTELRSQNAELEKSIPGNTSAAFATEEDLRYAESIVKTVREPLWVLDADPKIISVTRRFDLRGQGPGQTLLSGQCAASGRRTGAAELLMAVALFLPLFLPQTLPAQEPLKTYQTHYAAISYTEVKDLHTFTGNIGSGLSFLRESPERNPLLVKTQVDKIVDTICSLLDMYPPNLRFGITLYRTQAEVTTAYYRASAAANAYKAQSMTGAAPISFYSHGTRNIAVAIDSIDAGILTHEIAHAVISAYFVMPPPARMQEILAQYLDKNLRDK
jgi:hypothetical protein